MTKPAMLRLLNSAVITITIIIFITTTRGSHAARTHQANYARVSRQEFGQAAKQQWRQREVQNHSLGVRDQSNRWKTVTSCKPNDALPPR